MTKHQSKQVLIPASYEVNTHNLVDNLVDLYWFLHIIDAGSFSTAASIHGVSKSSLSRRVNHLEKRLGAQLLHRNPRFLSLTSIGAEVYRHTLNMLTAAQQVTESVQQALETPSGQVNIILPSILNNWLLPALHTFKKLYPEIHIALHSADTTQELNSQSIDLALSLSAAPADSTQIVSRPLASLTFVNMISAHSNSAEQYAPIQLSYLDAEENSCLVVTNYSSALKAVAAGLGYANLPLCACQVGLKSGELKYFNYQESTRTLFAFTQPHRGITLATRVLLDYLTLHISQSRTVGILPIKQLNEEQVD